MDQDTLVNERIEDGRALIHLLEEQGFNVQAAFWARPVEEKEWFLYLASDVVNDKGPAEASKIVQTTLKQHSELGIDLLDTRVIRLDDSRAAAALSIIKPKVPNGPFALPSPKPFQGITHFGGSRIGGLDIEGGAYIYPPSPTPASA